MMSKALLIFRGIRKFLAISFTVPEGIYPKTGLVASDAIPQVISLKVPSPPEKIIASYFPQASRAAFTVSACDFVS